MFSSEIIRAQEMIFALTISVLGCTLAYEEGSMVKFSLVDLVLLSGLKFRTELHSVLFQNSTYNPRVIPNMWRQLSALDFADLGTFATDRCKVYNRSILKYR